jgi:hypothetical protein
MLPNFGYTVDRDFMEILPTVFDYLHVTDILDLLQTNKSVNALVSSRVALGDKWKSLELNASEGDSEQDVLWSSFVTLDDPGIVNSVLFANSRFEACEKLVMNQVENLQEFFRKKFVIKLIDRVVDLKVNRFRFDFGFVAEKLATLRLGIGDLGEESTVVPMLRLPSLRCLDISGFPIIDANPESKYNAWLLEILANTKIRRLRLNCLVMEQEGSDTTTKTTRQCWDSSDLSFFEINFTKDYKKSRQSGICASRFADMLITASKEDSRFAKLHTVVIGPPTTPVIISTLSRCQNMMHAVFNNFVVEDLSDFSIFFETVVANLQILICKIPGQSKFHFDSFLHMMMLAANGNSTLPPLIRFELEVVMDDETGVIKPPYHTVKGAAALRCRYPDNMFFKRSKYAIAMSSYRPLCTELAGPATIASPMELFAEEIVRGMHTESSTSSDADMYTEWNNLGQRMRGLYVEIFDEYVEREMRHGATTYSDLMRMLNDSSSREGKSVSLEKSLVCDVAATMANLRE